MRVEHIPSAQADRFVRLGSCSTTAIILKEGKIMATKKIKVKDLLTMEVDVDVYDNITEELAIAFCGSVELTKEGKFYFETILNRDVELDEENGVAIIDCHDEFFPDNDEFYLDMAKELFYAAAGYCTEEKYNRFFKSNADVAFLV